MASEPGRPSIGYSLQLAALAKMTVNRLVRTPQRPPGADASKRLWRDVLTLGAIGIVLVVGLMFLFDATEISLMPPRGASYLWPARIATDFGKDVYVLGLLAIALVVIICVTPLVRDEARNRLLHLSVRVQYLFLAVLVPVLAAQVLKWIVGRGRPFVGGKANPFNFEPFHGAEPYFSLPSGHSVTAFALAFAVAAVWPRTAIPIYLYAILVALSRLVLLAHHPSDVVAGALVGALGAMAVRYWFAARRLGFAIREGGQIEPR